MLPRRDREKKRQITALTTKSIENHQIIINLRFLHSERPFQMEVVSVDFRKWGKKCLKIMYQWNRFETSITIDAHFLQ